MIASDDLDLLRRFAHEGADEAFAEVVRRHGTAVSEACRRRLRDPAAADDAAQAVFLILARKAAGIVRARWWSRPLIADWLHRTAQHVCANHERQRRRRERHEREAAMAMADANSGSASADTERLRERIDAALAALPARYRQPVVLHYLEGRERAEVAAALGLSDEALKKRLQRGLEALRRRLGAPENAASAIVAALAPGASSGAAHLADTVAGYLAGAPVPATVTANVSGGLHAMRLAIAKTTIASCAALAVIGGAVAVGYAETAAPEATIAQGPKPHEVVYWDSLLDWTFELGGSNPGGDPEKWEIPKRMREYVVYRGVVDESGAIVDATALIGWRVSESEPVAMITGGELHGPDGGVTRFDLRTHLGGTIVFSQPTDAPGHFRLTLADSGLPQAAITSQHVGEYGPLIDGMGVPDLLLPVPAARWKLGQSLPITEGAVTLAAAEPRALDYRFDRLEFKERELFTHVEELFGQKVEIHILVGAIGKGTAHARWNAVDDVPEANDEQMAYQVRLRSAPPNGVGEPTALLAGTLTLVRSSGLLHGLPAQADMKQLTSELRNQRLAVWWERLQKPGDAPLLGDLAYSVLNGLEHPPVEIEDAQPKAQPEKKEF